MDRAQASLKDLIGAATLLVILLGATFLFLTTNFNSTEQVADNLSRFIWAFTHIAFPTSRFAVYLELALAAVGSITIGRTDARTAILSGFGLYFLINFVTAWMNAPVYSTSSVSVTPSSGCPGSHRSGTSTSGGASPAACSHRT